MSNTLQAFFLGFDSSELAGADASLLRTRIAATFWPHCSDGRATTAASEIWGLRWNVSLFFLSDFGDGVEIEEDGMKREEE